MATSINDQTQTITPDLLSLVPFAEPDGLGGYVGRVATLADILAQILPTLPPDRMGYASIVNNATVTTLQTAVPKKVEGTWTLDPLSVWFVIANNAIELTDPDPADNNEIIFISGSCSIPGGGSSQFVFFIAVNGMQIGNGQTLDVLSDKVSFSVSAPVVMVLGDYIELWVTRVSGNDDILITDATLVVR